MKGGLRALYVLIVGLIVFTGALCIARGLTAPEKAEPDPAPPAAFFRLLPGQSL